jgi:hypothetical protein
MKVKKYTGVYHVLNRIDSPLDFHENVEESIVQIQNAGYLVEIQYQQSDKGISALVLAYKMEEEK